MPSVKESTKRKATSDKKASSKTLHIERRLTRAKVKARSELDLFEWNKWRFAKQDFWIDPIVDTVDRIDGLTVPKEEFIEKYERPELPVVILNLTKKWPAEQRWNREYLIKQYGSQTFKVGEDDDENNVYLKMKHFFHYIDTESQVDDSPLYIFDSGFEKWGRGKKKSKSSTVTKSSTSSESSGRPSKRSKIEKEKKRKTLLIDYTVPDYFSDDLFHFTGARRRPPYKWFVMGDARSGTGIHTDPLGTSAWNALLKGHKRWAMFPPGTAKEIVDPPMKPYDHEAVSWFATVFPKFTKRDDPTDPRSLGEKLGMVQVLQRPGETIFVPTGWAHVVMNLDFTVAITQNFCSVTNLENVYLAARHSRPKLTAKLYRELAKRGETDPSFKALVDKLDELKFVPRVPPSSDGSSSSSTSSSSSSSSESDSVAVSDTDSDTDLEDGICMCRKCKLRKKKEAKRKQK
ncbi:hypothetical protein BC943DRAFT_360382 [Umbelopsis sp. AD052]|nr:hypothetical protein BC943DRAFT_360382 [Umbelopsis sp. AD052]